MRGLQNFHVARTGVSQLICVDLALFPLEDLDFSLRIVMWYNTFHYDPTAMMGEKEAAQHPIGILKG